MNLERFLDAQKYEITYGQALSELKNGRKQSHWMWYIFPQMKGLGMTPRSNYYGIESLEEAKAYYEHEILGARLVEACEALMALEESDPVRVMGTPDDIKLCSSMTLFIQVAGKDSIFQRVIDKFFYGLYDTLTLDLLGL